MAGYNPVPLVDYETPGAEEMAARSKAFLSRMQTRRTVRHFTDRPIPRAVIEACVATAGTAPSGANQQPWHFAIVSNAATKRAIREAAEAEEAKFYAGRAPTTWLEALAPLGTDPEKPFLEIAPYLIVVFQQSRWQATDGSEHKTYYPQESVGIACGMLLAALHHAGLATLTHTPSPMGFLREILGRPATERAAMIIVTGEPAENAVVPDIKRKSFEEIATFHD
jgi:nitroreductase